MVNLSRILKSLAVEHSLAVVVGFCICCIEYFCTDEFGGLSNSCAFPILSHFSWPLLFFIVLYTSNFSYVFCVKLLV